MEFILASNLSARVEELIERRFSLDALAALVQGYSVTLDSLLAAPAGGSAGRPPSPTMEMEARPWQ